MSWYGRRLSARTSGSFRGDGLEPAPLQPETPNMFAVSSRERTDCLSRLRITLREHYDERLERYGSGFPPNYDNELLRIFVNSGARKGQAASSFLRRHRGEIRRQVAQWVQDDVYAVDHVLDEMIGRCRELGLRAVGPERRIREDFSVLLAVTSMRCLYRSRDWHAM